MPSIWLGEVWGFSTQDYIAIDDFESYIDDIEAGESIFQTWIVALQGTRWKARHLRYEAISGYSLRLSRLGPGRNIQVLGSRNPEINEIRQIVYLAAQYQEACPKMHYFCHIWHK